MRELDVTQFDKPLKKRGVLTLEAFLTPGTETGFTFWEHDRIYLVRRGEVELELADNKVSLAKNEILYLPVSTWHRWKTKSDTHVALMTICFSPVYFAEMAPVAILLEDFAALFPANEAISPERSFDAVALRHLLASILREKRAQRPEAPAMIIGLFIELIAMLVSARKRDTELTKSNAKGSAFARSVAYLNERLSEEITVNDLAGIAGLSTRRYLDVFRDNFGVTPRRYIIEQRLAIAKELMIETGSILHASLDAGFANLSHFYRTFKQHTGMTPKQFIALQGAENLSAENASDRAG